MQSAPKDCNPSILGGDQDLSLASCRMKISLVVFKIANPSNGVRGRVGPPLTSSQLHISPDWLILSSSPDPSFCVSEQKGRPAWELSAAMCTKQCRHANAESWHLFLLQVCTAAMAAKSPTPPNFLLLQPIWHCCSQLGHSYGTAVPTTEKSRTVFR